MHTIYDLLSLTGFAAVLLKLCKEFIVTDYYCFLCFLF